MDVETLNAYQKCARETAIYPGKNSVDGLVYTSLGLGETGEFQNVVKKVLRDNNKVLSLEYREKLVDELGDVLWYVANAASELKIALSDLANRNLEKLESRKNRGTLKGSGDKR